LKKTENTSGKLKIFSIKTVIAFSLCFFLTLGFSSCSKNKITGNNQLLKDFVFQHLLYSETGKCDLEKPEKLYFYPNLKNFFLRSNVTSKGFLLGIELQNPEYTGIINGSTFYCGYADDASWVDELIEKFYQENSELITDDSFDFGRPYSISGSEGFEEIDTETVPSLWISSNRRLSFMKFKDEVFVPVQKDDNYILINSSGDKTSRSFYNKDFILQKKEIWKISTPKASEILQTEIYNYDDSHNLVSTEKESKEAKVITYYTKKLPVRTDKYVITENGSYLQSRSLWRYTTDDKISIEEVTEYFYKDSDYSRFIDKFTKRQTYIYHEDEETPPDYKYYENGKLKMKIDYQDKQTYVSKVLFTDDYEVTSYYEENMRKKDVYTVGGKVQRVKEYE